jgi:hypothetical protein
MLAVGLALGLAAPTALPAPVETDPSKPYVLTPEVGPWVILAASFKGANCSDFAHQAVLCVRQRDHLPAYVYDRGEEERRQQHEFMEQMRRENNLGPNAHLRTIHVEDECAVLIGGYRDMESARAALPAVKNLAAPTIQNYKPDLMVMPGAQGPLAPVYAVNPFANSFVTRNPTVPAGQENLKREYEFLKKLNGDEDFSLLACKAPWTLEVQTYSGPSVIQTSGSSNSLMKKIGLGDHSDDQLAATAKQAHEIARVLRKQGYEAYVLHTRRSSYVTVGSFAGPEDPKLQSMRARFTELAQKSPFLSPQPQPMRVPQPQ